MENENKLRKQLDEAIKKMTDADKAYLNAFYAGASHDELNALYIKKEKALNEYREVLKLLGM